MPPRTPHPRHVVTAVIVAHDGARLLPGLIQALRDQTHPVDRAVGVDTGSRDRSGALLAGLLGADAVFGMDPGTGYGAAVARALQHPAARRVLAPSQDPAASGSELRGPSSTEWVWLLHDDCQPAPDALEHLLRAASRYDTAAVFGPKLRDLADRRVLREVGITMDRAGRRLTGIEPGEIDQGQHDGNRNVLAVSSAGMLVRRDVWDQLGGFDPQLPLFRDDIDFCWRVHASGHDVRVVTDAVVYHRELSARHSRKSPAVAGHPRLLDRRSALYVFAVNLPLVPMLTVLSGCVTGSLLRAAYFLLTKQQRRAAGHLGALAWLFGHPGRVLLGRRRRAAGRKRAYAVLRPQVRGGRTLSRIAESAVGMLSRSSVYEGSGAHHGGAADDPDDDLPLPPEDSLIRRIATHPAVLLSAALVLVTVVSERSLIGSLLRGTGTLSGGALIPAWGGASDLWHEYLAGYHATGLGSAASAPPYLGVVAALATVLGGKPSLAVDVLLLGCVPFAGMGAYLATRRLTEALAARIWIAFTYALLPVATGAVAAGRLGTAVVFMLLPFIAMTLGRMFTRPPRVARRAAWASGLLIAIAAAFVPLLWLMAAAGALGVAGYSLWRSGGRSWARVIDVGIVALLPAAVLIPWTFQLFASPSSFLLEAGIQQPGLATAGLAPEPLLLLSPGGAGLPPVWVTVGLIVPAFCSLLLNRRRNLVLTGWGIALGGLVAAVVVSRIQLTPSAGSLTSSSLSKSPVSVWPGVPLAVAAAGLAIAATPVLEWAAGTAWGVAASSVSLGTRARLVGRRGAVALLLGVVALTAPVLAAEHWLVAGVGGPLGVAGSQILPPFIAAESAAQGQTRTLVLRRVNGVLTYQVLRSSDPMLGEPELAESSAGTQALSTAVASLAATDIGDSQDAAQALSQFAIGYVLLPAPVDPALAVQLDSVAGLQPLSVSSAYDLWRVVGTASRVRVVTAAGTSVPVSSGVVGVDSALAAGTSGTLELAEEYGGWSASLNGHALTALPRRVDGWAQGFVLPAGGGHLVITRDDLARDLALGAEAAVLLAAFVLALPGTRGSVPETLNFSGGNHLPGPPLGSAEVPAGPVAAPAGSVAAASQELPGGSEETTVLPGQLGMLPIREPELVGAWAMAPPPADIDAMAPPTAPAYAQASAAPQAPVPGPQAPAAPQGPAPAQRRQGGGHRAPRHSKPSRTWRGKGPAAPGTGPEPQRPPEETGQPLPPPPDEALSPDEGLPRDEAPWANEAPWTHAEVPEPDQTPPSGGSRPPWELGSMP